MSIFSAGVHSSYEGYRSDVELSKGGYSMNNAANSAGFYNDILADKLAERHPTITHLHAAPGNIATRWGTEMPVVIRWAVRFLHSHRAGEGVGARLRLRLFRLLFEHGVRV